LRQASLLADRRCVNGVGQPQAAAQALALACEGENLAQAGNQLLEVIIVHGVFLAASRILRH
jgi:hypothetical protein